MRLTDLDPRFLKIVGDRSYQFEGVPFSEAQGVMFLCPTCFRANGGSRVGVHSAICWFDGKGVPPDTEPKPGRWMPVGTEYENLTLNAPSFTPNRSILLLGGCGAHFHVTCGEIAFA